MFVEPAVARDTADEVLRQRPYLDSARPPSLQERVLDWIVDLVSDALGALSSAGGRGAAAWIVIFLFLLLIAWLVRRLVRNWSPMPRSEHFPDPEVETTRSRAPEEWAADAEAAEASGRWNDAVRLRHRALVAELVDHAVVSSRPGQTAGSIERTVSAAATPATLPMGELTTMFKQAWYGRVEMDAADVAAFRQRAAVVLAHINDALSSAPSDANQPVQREARSGAGR